MGAGTCFLRENRSLDPRGGKAGACRSVCALTQENCRGREVLVQGPVTRGALCACGYNLAAAGCSRP